MDLGLTAAAHALSRGDPLSSLKLLALRSEPQALALRATALAQLGEYAAAKRMFRRAQRGFDQKDALARARCVVGLADVALAAHELTFSGQELDHAIDTLVRRKDAANARYAQLLRARYALSRGDLTRASLHLESIRSTAQTRAPAPPGSPALVCLFHLARAELALRLMQPAAANAALLAAERAARTAGIAALEAEVEAALDVLRRPAARVLSAGSSRLVTLDEVAKLLTSGHLVVDGCRCVVRTSGRMVDFASRPVLFQLVRQLAEASPGDVAREELIRTCFGIQRTSESLRVRLRMSMTRLRRLLHGMAEIASTPRGFAVTAARTKRARPVYLLLPPEEDQSSSLLALVAGGEAWSTSALALALGASQRSVQRALRKLEEGGRVCAVGRGKSRRWLAVPLTRFATPLLLRATSPRV